MAIDLDSKIIKVIQQARQQMNTLQGDSSTCLLHSEVHKFVL